MRRFLARAALFFSPLVLLFVAYTLSFREVMRQGQTERNDLQRQVERTVQLARERDYELVALGNSRIFRGIQPALLSVPAHNFAYDDDDFDYYDAKTRFLLAAGKRPRWVLIGVDYFQFGHRNHDRFLTYARVLGDAELQRRAASLTEGLPLKARMIDRQIDLRFLYRNALVQTGKWLLAGRPPTPRETCCYIQDDGFFHLDVPSTARADDRLERTFPLIPEQEQHLRQAIDAWLRAGARPVLVMPPTRPHELVGLTAEQRAHFDRLVRGELAARGVPFLDFSTHPGFTLADYADTTHLTIEGSRKFTLLVDAELTRLRAGEPR